MIVPLVTAFSASCLRNATVAPRPATRAGWSAPSPWRTRGGPRGPPGRPRRRCPPRRLPTAIRNTAYFALLALVFGFPIPLVTAVLISSVRRLKGLYSVLAYLLVVVLPVVA